MHLLSLIGLQIVSCIEASVSHGLHELTPAPYLHPVHSLDPVSPSFIKSPYLYFSPTQKPHLFPKSFNSPSFLQPRQPKLSSDWYKRDRDYTVYRNAYDVTGPRELRDALRTQDEDVIVSDDDTDSDNDNGTAAVLCPCKVCIE